VPETLPGIDTAAGLARVNRNAALYRSLLVKLHDQYRGAAVELAALLERGDAEGARILAHTVKGVAGNVGAADLQEAAAAVEAALKAGEAVPQERMDALERTLAEVAEGLASLAQEELDAARAAAPAAEGEAADPARLREVLGRLEEQVRARKPKLCAPILEEMAGLAWPGDAAGQVAELQRLVKRYKFKDALALVEELVQSIEG
jgi:HPt (histidine-containing phosphotransfer) domain-containing protein